ncbi:MAG: hypothetical protein J6T10_21070 [Methanobrevibacter sp.]|nr:hypothetical protein [Methanobrevibacter sp.]
MILAVTYPLGLLELYGVYPNAVVTSLLVIPVMNQFGLFALYGVYHSAFTTSVLVIPVINHISFIRSDTFVGNDALVINHTLFVSSDILSNGCIAVSAFAH